MSLWLLPSDHDAVAAPLASLDGGAPMLDQVVQDANQMLGLSASTVIQLDVTDQPEQAISITIPINGDAHRVDLEPHSIRGTNSFVRVYGANGEFVDQAPGPVRTMRGVVDGIPGAKAAASLKSDGLHAMIIMPDFSEVWLEPIGSRVVGAAMNDYVVYGGDDVIPTGFTCATVNDKNLIAGQADALGNHGDDDGDGGVAGEGLFFCAEIGLDADVEYYNAHGQDVAEVTADMEAVINTVNIQYESQVDIAHVITGVVVRTQEPDPYTSNDAGTLLNQFASEWNNNQSGITRDMAHLFTGRQIAGTTIGIASLATVCNISSAYGLVQSDCCGSFACATDLSAHELGHNWSAGHCACPSNTMNPSLVCANNFSQATINQIISFRNSRPCLTQCIGNEDGFTTLPLCDIFPSTTIDPNIWTGITGVTADFAGNTEPSPPFSARINGNDELRSALIDLSLASNVTISYWWQRTGGGNSPETGEDLFVEYRLADGSWAILTQHPGAGSDALPFEQEIFAAPADALHDAFRLRFRSGSDDSNADDFFVDDIKIDGIVPPGNDLCADAPSIFGLPSADSFTTIGADTDGPDEAGTDCAGMEGDIWYRLTNTCDQVVRFEICDADFDTTMAIYGFSCPTGPGELIACNDDSCGTGSAVEIPLAVGLYRIRIGGLNGEAGAGTLNISCIEGKACPGDFDSSGAVDTADLLALLGAWGTDGDGADLADPLDLVDVADLLVLLSAWGDCL